MDGSASHTTARRRHSIPLRIVLAWSLAALVASNQTFAAERSESKSTAAATLSTTATKKSNAAAKKLTAAELAAEIDRQVLRKLEAKKIPLSPRTDDSEFLRRAYLDIAGTIPPLDRVETFLADSRSGKRARVIDELLASEMYVQHMVDQWREHLIPDTAAARRRRHETGIAWLEESFRGNQPYDEFIRGVLTAEGWQRDNGAVTFLLTHQSLDEATDRFSRVLLGVQITCAQCHNHPFADWKQDDYWGTAAFFSKVKHQFEKPEKVEHYGVSELGTRKPIMTPPSLKVVPPTFLGGVRPTLDPEKPYLPTFVDWLAADDNPYFARAFANRLWRKLMGRGIVEPVDDLRDANPGTHPELLALLGEQFRLNGFDIHYLIRAVTLSETYQRTSRPLDGNRDDAELYSHMPVKVMAPYVLGDSLQTFMRLGDDAFGEATASKKPAQPVTEDDKLKAKQRARGTRDSFASFFKGEDNAAPTAYEVGVPQALKLMNAQEMFRGSRVVAELTKKNDKHDLLLERIYLAALARRPTEEERTIALRYVKEQPDWRKGFNDVIWALLNSTEFATNH